MAAAVTFRKAVLADCEYLSSRLRVSDVAEIYAMSGEQPLEALTYSYAKSKGDVWVAEESCGAPIAIIGVSATDTPGVGMAWMLGTDKAYGKRVLRHSHAFLELLHEKYQTLFNYVPQGALKLIRWLTWCGFTVTHAPLPMGPHKVPFLLFYKHR